MQRKIPLFHWFPTNTFCYATFKFSLKFGHRNFPFYILNKSFKVLWDLPNTSCVVFHIY